MVEHISVYCVCHDVSHMIFARTMPNYASKHARIHVVYQGGDAFAQPFEINLGGLLYKFGHDFHLLLKVQADEQPYVFAHL